MGLALVLAVVLAVPAFTGAVPDEIPESGWLLSARYDPPASSVELGLARGDGQLFATHAADPFLGQPEAIRGGAPEQAYRFQRPLLGWLGWAASAGRPAEAPLAVVALSVLSVALLVGASASVLRRRGSDPRLALVLLATPGVVAVLQRVGPEALGAALALLGAVAWTDRRRPLPLVAVGCFALAGLCRETLLLVPFALVVADLVGRRRPVAAVARGAATVVPYVAWVLVLRSLLGAWPEGSVEGRLSPVPFAGLVDAAARWTVADAGFALVLLGAGALALVRTRERWLRAVVGTHLALAAVLGAPVWASWLDFGRVLVPLAVFALVALAPLGAGARGAVPPPGRAGAAGPSAPPADDPTVSAVEVVR